MATYKTLLAISELHNESLDCAVKAVALSTNTDYKYCHAILKALGRVDRRGCSNVSIIEAIRVAGFVPLEVNKYHFTKKYNSKRVQQNVTTYHPSRFNQVWADGYNYLIFSKGHVSAVVNGKLEDWASAKSYRATLIVAVVKPEQEVEYLQNHQSRTIKIVE
jgi:hypothetical protein